MSENTNDWAKRAAQLIDFEMRRSAESRESERLEKLQAAVNDHPTDFAKNVERQIADALLAQETERREREEALFAESDATARESLERLDYERQEREEKLLADQAAESQ